MSANRLALLATVALLAASAGYFTAIHREQNSSAQEVTPSDSTLATSRLLELSLADVKGDAQPLRQWQGKLLVVNFWASWCTPCREEIPGFSRLQEKFAAKGVQFVGIAFDSADNVEKFSSQTSPAYPLLIANNGLLPVAVGLGNVAGGLPFTVIVDRGGHLSQSRVGIWKEAALETTLTELTK